jgi:hypothetical protein
MCIVVTATGTGSAKQFTFACTGSNDGEEGMITTFKLEGIPLGTDDEGNETSAPVVIEAEVTKKRKNYNDMALDSLEHAIEQHGIRVPAGSPGFPDGTMAVSPDVWRARYFADCRDLDENVTDDAISRRYRRAVNDLIERNKVGRMGEWNWIVPPEVTLH